MLCLCLIEGGRAEEQRRPKSIVGESAILVNFGTGRVLYEKNADVKRAVASTQKLLTTLLIIQNKDMEELIQVEKNDTKVPPMKLWLSAGDKYPRGILVKSLLIQSCNDVARCLARDFAGGNDGFAVKMNAYARELGMNDSHFINPSGLTEEGQYSTARDMAKLARVAFKNPFLREIVNTKKMEFKYPGGKKKELINTNRLLGKTPYYNGMKTGYTDAAGRCLVSSATKDGKTLISVILGSTKKKIWDDSTSLLDWGLGIEKPIVSAKAKGR